MLAKVVREGPKVVLFVVIFLVAVIQIKDLQQKSKGNKTTNIIGIVDSVRTDGKEPADQSVVELKIFDNQLYENARKDLGEEQELCVTINRIKPTFKICLHNTTADNYVSGTLKEGKLWEPEMANFIQAGLQNYDNDDDNENNGIGKTKKSAVFLDVGANIGTHSLYALSSGHRVYAIEPLTINAVRLVHSSKLNNFESNLVLYQHTVDLERQGVEVKSIKGNIGGSRINMDEFTLENEHHAEIVQVQKVQSVLLQDVVEDVIRREQERRDSDLNSRIPIVVKMDIETYECRALLGSPRIFEDERIFIPYLVMEWFFSHEKKDGSHVYPTSCPQTMLQNMTDLLVTNEYEPFMFDGDSGKWRPLNAQRSLRWVQTNVYWKHKDAKDVFDKIKVKRNKMLVT